MANQCSNCSSVFDGNNRCNCGCNCTQPGSNPIEPYIAQDGSLCNPYTTSPGQPDYDSTGAAINPAVPVPGNRMEALMKLLDLLGPGAITPPLTGSASNPCTLLAKIDTSSQKTSATTTTASVLVSGAQGPVEFSLDMKIWQDSNLIVIDNNPLVRTVFVREKNRPTCIVTATIFVTVPASLVRIVDIRYIGDEAVILLSDGTYYLCPIGFTGKIGDVFNQATALANGFTLLPDATLFNRGSKTQTICAPSGSGSGSGSGSSGSGSGASGSGTSGSGSGSIGCHLAGVDVQWATPFAGGRGFQYQYVSSAKGQVQVELVDKQTGLVVFGDTDTITFTGPQTGAKFWQPYNPALDVYVRIRSLIVPGCVITNLAASGSGTSGSGSGTSGSGSGTSGSGSGTSGSGTLVPTSARCNFGNVRLLADGAAHTYALPDNLFIGTSLTYAFYDGLSGLAVNDGSYTTTVVGPGDSLGRDAGLYMTISLPFGKVQTRAMLLRATGTGGSADIPFQVTSISVTSYALQGSYQQFNGKKNSAGNADLLILLNAPLTVTLSDQTTCNSQPSSTQTGAPISSGQGFTHAITFPALARGLYTASETDGAKTDSLTISVPTSPTGQGVILDTRTVSSGSGSGSGSSGSGSGASGSGSGSSGSGSGASGSGSSGSGATPTGNYRQVDGFGNTVIRVAPNSSGNQIFLQQSYSDGSWKIIPSQATNSDGTPKVDTSGNPVFQVSWGFVGTYTGDSVDNYGVVAVGGVPASNVRQHGLIATYMGIEVQTNLQIDPALSGSGSGSGSSGSGSGSSGSGSESAPSIIIDSVVHQAAGFNDTFLVRSVPQTYPDPYGPASQRYALYYQLQTVGGNAATSTFNAWDNAHTLYINNPDAGFGSDSTYYNNGYHHRLTGSYYNNTGAAYSLTLRVSTNPDGSNYIEIPFNVPAQSTNPADSGTEVYPGGTAMLTPQSGSGSGSGSGASGSGTSGSGSGTSGSGSGSSGSGTPAPQSVTRNNNPGLMNLSAGPIANGRYSLLDAATPPAGARYDVDGSFPYTRSQVLSMSFDATWPVSIRCFVVDTGQPVYTWKNQGQSYPNTAESEISIIVQPQT